MIEIVNGIVIGEIETREYYKFFSEKDERLLWDAGRFENDQQAINAFWEKFSSDPWLIKQYKDEGIEMRVWK